MKPSEKAPEIERFLTGITGKDRKQTITGNKCMTCTGAADSFRDNLSKKEYTISGMCQKCQDSIYGADIRDLRP